MLSEDYLMRYIRIATAALAQMLGMKAAGLDQDALFLLDRTLEQILGLRIDLIRSLPTNDLFKLLADQERLDPGLLATLGDLFAGESDLLGRLGRPVDSLNGALNALALYLEAELSGPPAEGSLTEKVEALLTWVEPEQIPDETWFALFNFDEQAGNWLGASIALQHLLDRAGFQPDLVDLARDFYTALGERSDADLAEACLTRAEIKTMLDRLEGGG
jgi:hypothetical protein